MHKRRAWEFSVGGPIIKNKTFFFLTGEIQLAMAGESILDTSPSGGVGAGGTGSTGEIQRSNALGSDSDVASCDSVTFIRFPAFSIVHIFFWNWPVAAE